MNNGSSSSQDPVSAHNRRSRNPSEPQDPTKYKIVQPQASQYMEWPGSVPLGKQNLYPPVESISSAQPGNATSGQPPRTVPASMPNIYPGIIPNSGSNGLPSPVPGSVPGSVPGTLPGTLPNSVQGSINGSINGSVNGSINSSVPGAVNGSVANQYPAQGHSSLDGQSEWNTNPYQQHQRMYTAGPRYFPYQKYGSSNGRYQPYYQTTPKAADNSNGKHLDYNNMKMSMAPVPPIPMGVPLLSAPLVKDSRRKDRHQRSKSRSHKSFDAARSIETDNSFSTLIAPAFVPGMPINSNHTGPPVSEKPPGGFYWALLSRNTADENSLSFNESGYMITLPIQMCEPPLKNIVPAYPQALQGDPEPRTRKQSKYTAEQDKLILKLKEEGKSWAEIASEVNCHNQLAARNRYQVLIGQQGGGTFFWTADDCRAFQALLDEGERAKWLFIAQELSKKCNQRFTIDMVHYKICKLFSQRPERFNILKTRDPTRGGAPYKRKLM